MDKENVNEEYTHTNEIKSEFGMIFIPRLINRANKYVPVAFYPTATTFSKSILIIPDSSLYEFGILASSVHYAWLKAVAKMTNHGYIYSASTVYNNFIWSIANQTEIDRIEKTAQAIIDIRARFPINKLAEIYVNDNFPKELADAHEANDKEILNLYGLSEDASETEIVNKLMQFVN